MSIATPPITDHLALTVPRKRGWGLLGNRRVRWGGGLLLFIAVVCAVSIFFTHEGGALGYTEQYDGMSRTAPTFSSPAGWLGYDELGRSLFARCLFGGAISLAVGFAAAAISVVLGVAVGLVAGYAGGWVDAALMRSVDVLYGLPYILLVILFKLCFEGPDSSRAADLIVLFSAIGLVSWLTMARVVRGQVLALRAQPFIEACRALGLPHWRIFLFHILPNLVGPITVYATLTIPQAILQESFLSFLGIGIRDPMPTWGSLVSNGIRILSPIHFYWWTLLFPCVLLVVTLLSLNFLGDGLRDVFDPKREAAKI